MRLGLAFALLAVGTMACGGVQAYAGSTFEAGDDGWMIGNNGTTTAPTLKNQGGLPGANICGTDADPEDIWYFWAPPKYLGNASAVYGKHLTFDLEEGQSFNQIHGRDVLLNGGGLAVRYNFGVSNNNLSTPRLDWTSYSITIDDQGAWLLDDGSQPLPAATEAQLRQVLGSLTALRIRGEYSSTAGNTTCLDNVYFGRN